MEAFQVNCEVQVDDVLGFQCSAFISIDSLGSFDSPVGNSI